MNSLWGYLIGTFCGGIVLLGLLALGIYLIYAAISSRNKAKNSQGWPSVTGTITRSDIESSRSTDSEGETTTWHTPVVEYDYEVLGTKYHGKRTAFGATTNYATEAKAREALAAFPNGQAVAVYYNPLKPDEAVLEQKARATNGMLAAGIVLVVMTVCGGCAGIAFLIYKLFETL